MAPRKWSSALPLRLERPFRRLRAARAIRVNRIGRPQLSSCLSEKDQIQDPIPMSEMRECRATPHKNHNSERGPGD